MTETESYNYCIVQERTDIGCKRAANEDHVGHFITPNGLVAVVCDGMGGHVGGAEASHTAVGAIRDFLSAHYFENPNDAIIQAAEAANNAVLAKTAEHPELRGMGSTCVMLIVRDALVYIGWVGDSRIYLIRNNAITQLTKDQSFVQWLVDAGEITAEEAEHHPRKNEITNALGLEGMTPAVVLEDAILPQSGDCFLLCSDGLTNMVPESVICQIVSNQSEMNTQERVSLLVDKARENGGLDNITAQIVEFAYSPSMVDETHEIQAFTPVEPSKPKFKFTKLIPFAAALIVVGFIALLIWRPWNNGCEQIFGGIVRYNDSVIVDFSKHKVIVSYKTSSINRTINKDYTRKSLVSVSGLRAVPSTSETRVCYVVDSSIISSNIEIKFKDKRHGCKKYFFSINTTQDTNDTKESKIDSSLIGQNGDSLDNSATTHRNNGCEQIFGGIVRYNDSVIVDFSKHKVIVSYKTSSINRTINKDYTRKSLVSVSGLRAVPSTSETRVCYVVDSSSISSNIEIKFKDKRHGCKKYFFSINTTQDTNDTNESKIDSSLIGQNGDSLDK